MIHEIMRANILLQLSCGSRWKTSKSMLYHYNIPISYSNFIIKSKLECIKQQCVFPKFIRESIFLEFKLNYYIRKDSSLRAVCLLVTGKYHSPHRVAARWAQWSFQNWWGRLHICSPVIENLDGFLHRTIFN